VKKVQFVWFAGQVLSPVKAYGTNAWSFGGQKRPRLSAKKFVAAAVERHLLLIRGAVPGF